MSEHDEEEDSYDEEIYETRSGRSGAYSGVGGAMGRRSGRSSGRRDRERERSGSRERSLSPRTDRRSHNLPPRPAKVTLVKSRKNEGEAHKVGDKMKKKMIGGHFSVFETSECYYFCCNFCFTLLPRNFVLFQNRIKSLNQHWLTAREKKLASLSKI